MPNQEFTTEELAHEEWRPVLGYEGSYCVSSLGRVRNLNPKRVTDPNGILGSKAHGQYPRVLLNSGDAGWRAVLVHRLVADAFLGKRPEGYHVNHIDGVKSNARASNLEYVTPKENTAHAMRTGLFVPPGFPKDSPSFRRPDGSLKAAKLCVDDIITIRRRLLAGDRPKVIAEMMGVSRMTVSQVKLDRVGREIEPYREDVRSKLGTPWLRANKTNVGYTRRS